MHATAKSTDDGFSFVLPRCDGIVLVPNVIRYTPFFKTSTLVDVPTLVDGQAV